MSDTSIIREVEEELRRERLEKIWQRYAPILIAVAAAIVLGVAGYKGWQSWQASRAASAGAQFEEVLQLSAAGKAEDAARLLGELGASGPVGYKMLARLKQASDSAAAGKADEAVAAYDAVAADGSVDPVLKGYARIAAATLLVDKVDSTAIENRLKDLDAAESPWRHGARELLGLAAFRAGQIDVAERHFTALLIDPAAPQGLRRRAEMMMSLIVADRAKTGG
jgi:hypothetical protein